MQWKPACVSQTSAWATSLGVTKPKVFSWLMVKAAAHKKHPHLLWLQPFLRFVKLKQEEPRLQYKQLILFTAWHPFRKHDQLQYGSIGPVNQDSASQEPLEVDNGLERSMLTQDFLEVYIFHFQEVSNKGAVWSTTTSRFDSFSAPPPLADHPRAAAEGPYWLRGIHGPHLGPKKTASGLLDILRFVFVFRFLPIYSRNALRLCFWGYVVFFLSFLLEVFARGCVR